MKLFKWFQKSEKTTSSSKPFFVHFYSLLTVAAVVYTYIHEPDWRITMLFLVVSAILFLLIISCNACSKKQTRRRRLDSKNKGADGHTDEVHKLLWIYLKYFLLIFCSDAINIQESKRSVFKFSPLTWMLTIIKNYIPIKICSLWDPCVKMSKLGHD